MRQRTDCAGTNSRGQTMCGDAATALPPHVAARQRGNRNARGGSTTVWHKTHSGAAATQPTNRVATLQQRRRRTHDDDTARRHKREPRRNHSAGTRREAALRQRHPIIRAATLQQHRRRTLVDDTTRRQKCENGSTTTTAQDAQSATIAPPQTRGDAETTPPQHARR